MSNIFYAISVHLGLTLNSIYYKRNIFVLKGK